MMFETETSYSEDSQEARKNSIKNLYDAINRDRMRRNDKESAV